MNEPTKVMMLSDLGPVRVEVITADQVRLSIHLSPPRGPVFTFASQKIHGRWQMTAHKLWDAHLLATATQTHIAFVKWARQHPNLFRMVSLLQRMKK